MTNKQILEELKAAMKANNEARVKSNEAMCHAINVVANADKEYERGMNDAWEIVKEIYAYNYRDLEKIFGEENPIVCGIIKKYTPMEAKEKLDIFTKNEKEIVPGDIVKYSEDNTLAVVLDKDIDDQKRWVVFTENGCVEYWVVGEFTRTGDHKDMNFFDLE